MSRIRTVLIPVDFSAPSEAALSYGYALAARVGARVRVLHVCDPPWTRHGGSVPIPPDSTAALAAQAERRLRGEFAAIDGTVDDAHAVVRVGEPRAAILQYADELMADIIVMGTHGWHGAEPARLGSVARHVVHAARCPVLTVRDGARAAA